MQRGLINTLYTSENAVTEAMLSAIRLASLFFVSILSSIRKAVTPTKQTIAAVMMTDLCGRNFIDLIFGLVELLDGFFGLHLRRQFDCLLYTEVSSATTKIARHSVIDIFIGRVWLFPKQYGGRHNLT